MGNNEIKDLLALQVRAKRTFLRWKSIHYVLNTDSAEFAFKMAGPSARKKLQDAIDAGDLATVKAWVETHSQGALKHWSYRKLRERAKTLNIPRWSRLEKDELITEIKKKKHTSS